jgi:hypothetical protein
MAVVLKEFISLASGVVGVGALFSVQFRVEGNAGEQGTIVVSCADPSYMVSPDIPVSLDPGQASRVDDAKIMVTGPAGANTVLVQGLLIETHGFPQDVQ